MEYTRLNSNLFFGTEEKFSRLNLDSGYTGIIYPLWVSLYERKKSEPRIEVMETLISLRILSITLNARMTKTNIISCGATHQS